MDVVAPVIDPQSLSPADYGNTIHSAQPLAARITDAGSGVDAGSIVFTLFDHTAGTSSTHTAVSYADGWAKTAAISLTVGRVYRIGVEAEDVAGNLAYWEQ